jgi:hypothetical protein
MYVSSLLSKVENNPLKNSTFGVVSSYRNAFKRESEVDNEYFIGPHDAAYDDD